jgi:hypothetical protein
MVHPAHHKPATTLPRKRILIVGGVAGGASCAARLRRLDEDAYIAMFDRGTHVAFANCGLPYYVGNVITEEAKLIVSSQEQFRERFNVEVFTQTEARRGTNPTSRWSYPQVLHRSGRRCPALIWTGCLPCAASPIRAASAAGSTTKRCSGRWWSGAASSV